MEDSPGPPVHGRRRKPPRPKCGAHARSTGQPCKRGAGAGTSHPGSGRCSNHGGSSPSGERAAERQAAEAAAARFGLPVSTGPTEALQAGLERANGIVAWLLAQLQILDPAALTWGTTKRRVKSGEPGEAPRVDVTQEAKPHILLQLLADWDRRLMLIAAEMKRLGIEERLAYLAQVEGEHAARVIQGTLDDLQLTAQQKTLVPEIVPRRIREILDRPDEPGEVVRLSDRTRRRPGQTS